MLRFSSLIFIILVLGSACKSRREKLMSSQSEKSLKIIKHKNQNTTLENSDLFYNTDSDEALKEQYKTTKNKRQELEQFQPSRRSSNLDYEPRKKKVKPPKTYY
jgi:hypothetical protein